MLNESVSNITLSSNISNIKNFEKNVMGYNELKKIHEKTNEQNKLYRKGALPYYCNNEQSWGFVKLENGNVVQSCRCELINCKYYNTCIEEPYSKKIIRESDILENDENKDIKKPKWRIL